MSSVLYKDYFSPDEAADYCCVSREEFDRTIRNRIPELRFGKRIAVFRRIDLNDRDFYPNAPQLTTFRARRRQLAVRDRTPPWADKQAIAAIYAEARRLTRETGICHHVDHEIPLQGKLVSGLHVAENLRVIPALENFRKGNR